MKRYDKETLNTVHSMIADGLTDDQISKKTKVKVYSVRYYRRLKPSYNTKKHGTMMNTRILGATLSKLIRELKTAQRLLR